MSTNRFDLIRNKYMSSSIRTTLTQEDKDANILEQISAYNATQTDVFIQQVSEELTEQKQINAILKQKNFENNTKEIETFVEGHNEEITNQLAILEDIFVDLKHIYEENQELHKDQEEYNKSLDSEKVKKIATEMRKIKGLKQDILSFLYNAGIRDKTSLN